MAIDPADDPLGTIAQALEATAKRRTARVEYRSEWHGKLAPGEPPLSRRFLPGPLAPLRPLARRLGRHIVDKVRVQIGEGVVDFEHRLVAIDFSAYAQLIERGQARGGRSGGPPHPRVRSAGSDHPLWFADLLRGAVDAKVAGTETVRGVRCTRLTLHTDLLAASAASPDGMATPAGVQVEDLARLPIECWVDDELLIRQLRYDDPAAGPSPSVRHTSTVELFDFGIPVAREWPNLPSFRTKTADSK